uniref:Transcription and mRNA export factor ENY2 n=2 Tax=Populus alba TaxID=43335 RepID=A0A4U5NB20_POPAL|nr:hypothetical protein D5086_0000271210 [Populus alba]
MVCSRFSGFAREILVVLWAKFDKAKEEVNSSLAQSAFCGQFDGEKTLELVSRFALRLFDFIISSQSMRNSVNRPPTPDDTAEEEEEKQPSLHETINIKLIESGEKERLTELLRERLIECGWKDEMKALCRAFIKKKGRNNVTVDDLVHVITPKGRVSIPDSVKAELLQRIRSFLVQAAV